jgi:hypothetical protein
LTILVPFKKGFKDVFGNVVVIIFQSDFCLEIHQNNIFFYFLKIIFYIITSKQSKSIKKIKFKLKTKKWLDLGYFKGLQTNPGHYTTYLQYADALIFLPDDCSFLLHVKRILRYFEIISGLKVNFYKSSLIELTSMRITLQV